MNQIEKQVVKWDDIELFFHDYKNWELNNQTNREYKFHKGNLYETKKTYGSFRLTKTYSYTYGRLNELLRERVTSGNPIFENYYEYDVSGNRTSKLVYEYKKTYVENEFGLRVPTYGMVLTDNISYFYDPVWNDRLIKVIEKLSEYETQAEKDIVYDSNIPSNPIFYGKDNIGIHFDWEGRNLTTYFRDSDGLQITYEYGFDGLRLSKTIVNKKFQYFYDNGKLIKEESPNTNLYFLYDEYDKLYGFINCYDNRVYYYDRDIFGNINGIIDSNCILVVEYEYDSYGNVLGVIGKGANVESGRLIGLSNPFRYKGYYYDQETSLYYCNSRYYNPKRGRWINADDVSYLDTSSVNGLNLYAYCANNPIMFCDPSGKFLISTAIALGFWIGLVIGAVAGATAGGIMAYNVTKDQGATGWELFCWTALGIVGGGVAGAAIGSAVGSAIGWGTAPVSGSNGTIALWSGGQGAAGAAASNFAASTGANLVTNTFAGKTLTFASHFLPKTFSNFLWGKLSAEFVAGATSTTIFLYGPGIAERSTFYMYEIWVLLEKGINRIIEFIG